MDYIAKFDKNKIRLINDKKMYRIKYNALDNIQFNISNVYSPFGIEKYNNKDILNLELDISNNQNYNIMTFIKELDEWFKNISSNDPQFVNKFNDYNYNSPIKYSDNKILIRTHLSNKLKIKTKDNTPFVLKKNKFNINLEFSSLWHHYETSTFGLILTVNIIDLT